METFGFKFCNKHLIYFVQTAWRFIIECWRGSISTKALTWTLKCIDFRHLKNFNKTLWTVLMKLTEHLGWQFPRLVCRRVLIHSRNFALTPSFCLKFISVRITNKSVTFGCLTLRAICKRIRMIYAASLMKTYRPIGCQYHSWWGNISKQYIGVKESQLFPIWS